MNSSPKPEQDSKLRREIERQIISGIKDFADKCPGQNVEVMIRQALATLIIEPFQGATKSKS